MFIKKGSSMSLILLGFYEVVLNFVRFKFFYKRRILYTLRLVCSKSYLGNLVIHGTNIWKEIPIISRIKYEKQWIKDITLDNFFIAFVIFHWYMDVSR